jgi:hypothetical protein
MGPAAMQCCSACLYVDFAGGTTISWAEMASAGLLPIDSGTRMEQFGNDQSKDIVFFGMGIWLDLII